MAGKKATGKKKREKRSGESLRTILWALAIALFIRTFFVQAFRIPSGSMEDTLLIGDFLLVDKLTYGATVPGTDFRFPGFREPRRGDIIVFKDPRTNRDYIKRCIGTGGETIMVRDNEVFIGEQPLEEPYKALKNYGGGSRSNFGPHRITDDSLFMMGDNRNNSQDSRYWGDLKANRVIGRAFVLYWSTDPSGAPAWVRNMSENWIKGLLQLFLGRPRITRLGTWLARDWSETYESGEAGPASVAGSGGADTTGSAAPGTARAAPGGASGE